MFIVYDKNMNLKPFPKGVRPLDIFIGSISKKRNTGTIEGAHRRIDKGYTYDTRPIELSLMLDADSSRDYRLLRDKAFSFFDDDFYVAEKYQKNKLYKVMLPQSYIPERLNRYIASITFPVEIVDIAFGQSRFSTQQLKELPAIEKMWDYGLGIDINADELVFIHESISFKIFNAGDKPVHPYEQDLKIKISDVVGSTEYLQLKNITNGSAFRTTEAVSNQTIVLDGPNVTSNGLQYYRNTNHQFITLDPGWNEFEVSGASNVKTEFDFRFYFD